MATKEIEEKVKQVLVNELDMSIEKITLNSSLVDDLGIDSFGSIEIVFALEKKFSIEIPDETLKDIKTVGDIVNYIGSQTKKRNNQ